QANVLRASVAESQQAAQRRAGRDSALYNIASGIATYAATDPGGAAKAGKTAPAKPATAPAPAVTPPAVSAPTPTVGPALAQGYTAPAMATLSDPLLATAAAGLGVSPNGPDVRRYTDTGDALGAG